MNDKTLTVLAAVAAVLVLATIWVGSSEPTVNFEFQKGQPLVRDIDPGRIDTIEISKGDDQVRLQRAGPKQFLVESAKNYPASNREVNTLLNNVTDIKLAAEVTDDPSLHAKLNVAAPGADTTVVKFFDADGKELIGVLLGSDDGGASYARLASSNQVYRTESSPWLRTKSLDFVAKDLVQLTRADIQKVQVNPASGRPYSIVNSESGSAELQNVPEGKKVKSSTPDGVLNAATYVNFTDFAAGADKPDLAFDSTYVVTTRHGGEYTFEIATEEVPPTGDATEPTKKYWVRGRARYTGPKSLEVEGKTQEQLQENEKFIESNKAVDTFNASTQGWIYELSSWKAEQFVKPFDDLVEDDDGKPEKVSASHILIPYQGSSRADAAVTRTKEEAEQLAKDLLAQVQADPSKLGELAMEHSSCPSKEKGGDLGEFSFETMAKPFSEMAFSLEVGQVAGEVVETEFGYHVIQRTK